MAITEIPLRQAPPPEPQEEPRPLTEAEENFDWENSPLHLIQLKDDLARSRLREAFWISVIVHFVVIFSIATAPKWIPGYRPITLANISDALRDKNATFLTLPPDLQKPKVRPKTDVMSDKDRIATSRHPVLNRDEVRKILDARKAGAPGMQGPGQTPAPPSPPPQVAQGGQGQKIPGLNGGPVPIPPSRTETAQLPSGSQGGRNPFSTPMSPGSAIEQAARASAASRGGGGGGMGGEYGMGQQGNGTVQGAMEILSDTMGVDFGPYLARVKHTVEINWWNLIPEVARAPLMKRGKVSIVFAITKDGKVAGMRLDAPSGDVSLDRAAWGGITASNPFPPLPSEFGGQYLALRFTFFYNPARGDLE